MLPLEPILCRETPREILAADYKLPLSAIPISGGWGYSQSDACIIDKNDPHVDPASPFDGLAIERLFVEKRIYEEMIIFRPRDEIFAGIRWHILEQRVVRDGGRIFDRLEFEVTAFRDYDWDELKAAYEGPQGYGTPDFDQSEHSSKHEEKKLRFIKEFWFDITSFY